MIIFQYGRKTTGTIFGKWRNHKLTGKYRYGFLKSKDFPDGVIFIIIIKDIDFDESNVAKRLNSIWLKMIEQ